MGAQVAVGVSEGFDAVETFSDACDQVRRELDEPADLCVAFICAPHIAMARPALEVIQDQLAPAAMIGCGAGGVLGGGREYEQVPAAVVWAASLPGAELTTVAIEGGPGATPEELVGVPGPEQSADAILVLADPYSFATDALLQRLNAERPAVPVLGGLASAGVSGAACLIRDQEIVESGAVACLLDGVDVIPCVSQGARPIGPEMTITAASDHLVYELASKPAMERLGEVINELGSAERDLASRGLMLGVVIDENRPEHEHGDFLVRPIVGADASSGAVAIGERVRVGQTVRLHVRDRESADQDLVETLELHGQALGSAGAAGALIFTCNGRGEAMFGEPDHDSAAFSRALGAPTAGFFCAGELGPVAGSNFLHGYTATAAVFGAG